MMEERDIVDLLPEYLLGTLDPDQAQAVEAALAESPALRREAESVGRVLFALPESLDPEPLPDEAWTKLQTAVRAEPPVRQSTVGKRGPWAAMFRTGLRPTGIALALSLVLLVVVGAWGWQGARMQADLANEQRIIAYWMRNPDLQIVSLRGVGAGARPGADARPEIPPGVVCVLPDGRAMMLQPYAAPGGSRYVLYGITPQGRVELGETSERFMLFDASKLIGVELALQGRRDELVAEARF